MNIGFTGTRSGMSDYQKNQLRAILRDFPVPGIFSHGDAIGADAEAHQIALEEGWQVSIHPPLSLRYRAFCKGAKFYLAANTYEERNRNIVACSQLLIAAPRNELIEERRSGTWHAIRYAKKVKKVIRLLPRKAV